MTTLKFSYEYFHDNRTADRGNPSQATLPTGSTQQNPGFPFSPNGDLQAFYGSPTLNLALANVHTLMGFIDHDFGNGLTVKNGTYYAEYNKFYQNVYPGNGPLSGAVNPTDTSFNRAAYNHTTNRDNFFNETDFFYKVYTGPSLPLDRFRNRVRPAGRHRRPQYRDIPEWDEHRGGQPVQSEAISGRSISSTSSPAAFSRGVTTPGFSNSHYNLNIQSGYARDTIDITPWLQVIGAGRYDRFDEAALDHEHRHQLKRWTTASYRRKRP